MSVTYTGPYKKGDIKKVVLVYSGGLDTSVILKWLQTAYGCEVVTFTADLGQGEELGPARKKAELAGVKPENIFIDDVREEFVRDFVFRCSANALTEANTLGTSIGAAWSPNGSRSRQVDAVRWHTARPARATTRCASSSPTALKPDIKVIAPWRRGLTSRTKRSSSPRSTRSHRGTSWRSAGLSPASLCSSSEGRVMEDPGGSRQTGTSAPSRPRGA
jgi:argininosuccinate synthase